MFYFFTLQFNNMSELASFQARLKQATEHMKNNIIGETITELKHLSKDVSNYLTMRKIQQNDQLSEIQITIFNNLACLYEKKGKYRTSLYHLQIAQELENKYVNHKYNDAIPLQELEKMSTTYSNLSAIQSKLGIYKEAILNAKFAIQLLSQNEDSKDHRSLVYLYYNYSFLLDVMQNYNEAVKYVLEGLKLASKYEDKKMVENYQSLHNGLKDKLAKRQSRRLRQIKKHLRGQLGIVKTQKQIEQNLLKEDETLEKIDQQAVREEKSLKYNKISSLKEYLNSQKKYFSKPSFPHSRDRNNSTYTTLNNNRKARNFSYYSNARSKKQTIDQKTLRRSNLAQQFNQDVVRIQLQSDNSNRIPPITGYVDYGYLTGKIRPNNQKFNRTSYEGKVDFRIKSKKCRLEEEINDLNKKNEALEKIIEKIYDSQKKAKQQ